MRYIVIPKGISKPIFESQVIGRFQNSEIKFLSYESPKKIEHELSKFSDLNAGDQIYFRSVTDFFRYKLVYLFSKSSVTTEFDFRGIVSEESYLRNKSITRRLLLGFLEYFAFKYADHLFTVSLNLADYLKVKYYKREVKVIPCCVPSNICLLKEGHINDKKIHFIYVGSMSKWQSFDRVCELYASVQSEQTSFTVVTKDTTKANKLLKKYKVIANLVAGDRNFVLNELDKADFGFIYRTDSIVNRTASPLKFLEYTARGVIPIMSDHVGDYSNIFKGTAYVVEDEAKKLNLSRLTEIRSAQSTYVNLFKLTNQFTWGKYDFYTAN